MHEATLQTGEARGQTAVQVQRDSWSHFLNAGSVAPSPLVELGRSPRPDVTVGRRAGSVQAVLTPPRVLSLLSKGGKGAAGPPGSAGEQGARGGQVSAPAGPVPWRRPPDALVVLFSS